jgi:hypothetical protein
LALSVTLVWYGEQVGVLAMYQGPHKADAGLVYPGQANRRIVAPHAAKYASLRAPLRHWWPAE